MNTVVLDQGGKSRLHTAVDCLRNLSYRSEARIIVGVLLAYAALLLLILLLPGRTYLGNYSNDFMIFVDGAYRIVVGQIPNQDFHTPLGPIAFLLPGFGLWAGGSMGAMMPIATATFAIIFAPLMLYVAATRLPLGWALAFGLFMLLLVVVPLNPGDPADRTSFAMFYNRFCWAMLSTLFLMILRDKSGALRPWLDATVMAALLLLMFYLKVNYAAVGLAFTLGLVLLHGTRRAALLALVMTAAGVLLIELFWAATGNYIADIRAAAEASGTWRGSIFTLGRYIIDNLSDFILVAGIMSVALLRGARTEYLLFALYMAAVGIVLLNQSAQDVQIITLIPAALVAILAPGKTTTKDRFWPTVVGALVIAALITPPTARNILALSYEALKAAQAPSDDPFYEQLDGVVVQEGGTRELTPSLAVLTDVYRTGTADVDTVNMLRHSLRRQPITQTEYLRSLAEARDILQSDPKLAGRVFAFDMANPLNALAGRTPPTGIDAWNHVRRTFSPEIYRAPELEFANVDVVMWPKMPVELTTFQAMRKLYGPYVESHYELVTESTYWRAYRRKAG